MSRPFHLSLIESIGMQSAVRMLEQFGGRRVYIPTTLDAVEHLRSVLDEDEIETLCLVFGPGTYYIPLVDTVRKLLRNRAIRQQHDEGENLCTLALDYGLSIRHVRRIIDQQRNYSPSPAIKQMKNGHDLH